MAKLNISSKKPLKSGYDIPTLGFGIDSAFMYHNEASCGEAIKNSGIPREDIFFTTKIYGGKQMSQSYAAKQIDETIANSGLTYVDLILIHSPDGGPAGRK
ncbi:hypothetical protein V491_08867, partial [Pseudogymnoascus sp. VKM F-3775]